MNARNLAAGLILMLATVGALSACGSTDGTDTPNSGKVTVALYTFTAGPPLEMASIIGNVSDTCKVAVADFNDAPSAIVAAGEFGRLQTICPSVQDLGTTAVANSNP